MMSHSQNYTMQRLYSGLFDLRVTIGSKKDKMGSWWWMFWLYCCKIHRYCMVWGNSAFMVGCQLGWKQRSSHYLALLWHLIKDVFWFIAWPPHTSQSLHIYRLPFWVSVCSRKALLKCVFHTCRMCVCVCISFQRLFSIDCVLKFLNRSTRINFQHNLLAQSDMLPFWLGASKTFSCFPRLEMNALPWCRWSSSKGGSLIICKLSINETFTRIFV